MQCEAVCHRHSPIPVILVASLHACAAVPQPITIDAEGKARRVILRDQNFLVLRDDKHNSVLFYIIFEFHGIRSSPYDVYRIRWDERCNCRIIRTYNKNCAFLAFGFIRGWTTIVADIAPLDSCCFGMPCARHSSSSKLQFAFGFFSLSLLFFLFKWRQTREHVFNHHHNCSTPDLNALN